MPICVKSNVGHFISLNFEGVLNQAQSRMDRPDNYVCTMPFLHFFIQCDNEMNLFITVNINFLHAVNLHACLLPSADTYPFKKLSKKTTTFQSQQFGSRSGQMFCQA